MTSSSTTSPDFTADGRRVPLVRATAETALVALVVNLTIAATVVAVLDVADGYEPLSLVPVAVTTVLAVVASAVLLAVLLRFTRRAITIFRVIVVVGALASLMGPLSLLSSDQFPQATGAVVAWTAVLHLTTAATVLVLLSGRVGERT
jgi:hypothetical protein